MAYSDSIRIPEVEISPNARPMPVIGMGTAAYPAADSDATKKAIVEAIKLGYRHFDTSFVYGSEKPLGEAIVEALTQGLIRSREELFITSKLWCTFADRDHVLPAIKMSLRNLQLDYLDLYLMHWPLKLSHQRPCQKPIPKNFISPVDLKSVWEAMEECQRLGLAKAIGVSNFSPNKLQELLQYAHVPPAVNQVEMNPMWQQKHLRDFCKRKGIHITAYSPLGASNTRWGDDRILGCSSLQEIANERRKTTAQVSLRWAYEQGVSMVPKSFNKKRMEENLQIFDWPLTKDDLAKISKLPQRKGVLLCDVLGPHDLVKEIDMEA